MRASINGIEVVYEDTGEGVPLLIFGGFGADREFWAGAASAFPGYRIVTLDNRGVGETVYSGRFGVGDLAEDAFLLMKHLGIRRFNVLGWSMGSQIAQILAANHPDSVMGLVLVSTYSRIPARSDYLLRTLSRMAADGSSSVESLAVAVNAFCCTESLFAELRSTGTEMPLPDRVQDPKGLYDQTVAMSECDSLPVLGLIEAPTLVVHGTEDLMVPFGCGEMVASRIAGAELKAIDGEGHAIPLSLYAGDAMRIFDRAARSRRMC